MEIERKWLTQGWPQGQPDRVIEMEQGYISVSPTVRIRSHRETGKADRYVLCFKSKGGLVRQEIETDIDKALFDQLRDFIGKPLVKKVQRRYNLPGGLVLEANQVDPGQPTGFFYAEVEFASEADALLQIYSPATDSRMLKAHPEQFEALRNNYFYRREATAYRMELPHGTTSSCDA